MFETRIQTYWDDADPAGRVYFAHFFRFVEYAETELFRAAGTERMKLYDIDRQSSRSRPLPPAMREVFARAVEDS